MAATGNLVGEGTRAASSACASARIALLSPYGGTNLGDGAIQSAAIDGIRRLLPRAELWGITLNPDETRRRHDIPCFPLTGLRVRFYSETLFAPIEGIRVGFSQDNTESTRPMYPTSAASEHRSRKVWRKLKAVPVVGAALQLLLKCVRASLVLLHEIRHLGTSFRFARSMDMVIVAGGGQIDDEWGGAWGHPYALFRWAILARLVGIKFVVLSVGTGKVQTPLSRLFLRNALALACYRSYRDQTSKQVLAQWSFTEHDPCVPDLAFGLRLAQSAPIAPHGRLARTIGISPIAFGHSTRWPIAAPDIYSAYLSKLAQFVAKLDSIGHQVVLFTSSGSDRRVVTELLEKLEHLYSPALRERIRVPGIVTVEDLLSVIVSMDLVVASRLHGTILSHMLGKPVLAISFDPKVDRHMSDVGQSAFVLDIARFSVDDLMHVFESLKVDAHIVRRTVREHLLGFREPLDSQYRKIAALLAATQEGSYGRGRD